MAQTKLESGGSQTRWCSRQGVDSLERGVP